VVDISVVGGFVAAVLGRYDVRKRYIVVDGIAGTPAVAGCAIVFVPDGVVVAFEPTVDRVVGSWRCSVFEAELEPVALPVGFVVGLGSLCGTY